MTERLDDLLVRLANAEPPAPNPQFAAHVWARIRRREAIDGGLRMAAPARWAAASLALMVGAAFGGASAYESTAADELAVFQPSASSVLALVEEPQ